MHRASSPRYSLRVIVAVSAILYWLALFTATHVPIRPVPENEGGSQDKVMHLAAFSGLALLMSVVCATRFGVSWKLYAGVFVVIAAYGALDEVTQSLVRDRQPDWQDW